MFLLELKIHIFLFAGYLCKRFWILTKFPSLRFPLPQYSLIPHILTMSMVMYGSIGSSNTTKDPIHLFLFPGFTGDSPKHLHSRTKRCTLLPCHEKRGVGFLHNKMGLDMLHSHEFSGRVQEKAKVIFLSEFKTTMSCKFF